MDRKRGAWVGAFVLGGLPLFAAGLFGLMLGAFAVGPLADRFGRKALLVASMIVFGTACLASSYSDGLSGTKASELRYASCEDASAVPLTRTSPSWAPRDRTAAVSRERAVPNGTRPASSPPRPLRAPAPSGAG